VNFVLSAIAPETIVAAVAANTVWKKLCIYAALSKPTWSSYDRTLQFHTVSYCPERHYRYKNPLNFHYIPCVFWSGKSSFYKRKTCLHENTKIPQINTHIKSNTAFVSIIYFISYFIEVGYLMASVPFLWFWFDRFLNVRNKYFPSPPFRWRCF
jgi:hypothetical protein